MAITRGGKAAKASSLGAKGKRKRIVESDDSNSMEDVGTSRSKLKPKTSTSQTEVKVDGSIRVWDVRSAAKEHSTPLVEVNTQSRLTCLAGSTLNLKSSKRPQVKNGVSDVKEHEAVAEDS